MLCTAQTILVEGVGIGALSVSLLHDSERADTTSNLVHVILTILELLSLLSHQD